MTLLARILQAFHEDPWLRLAVMAFVLVSLRIFWSPAAQERGSSPYEIVVTEQGKLELIEHDKDPLIVELPASEDVGAQIAIALASGRAVHIKDQHGKWRSMSPPRGPDGKIQDHSETLAALSKISCADDAPEEIKKRMAAQSESFRKMFCGIAATTERPPR